MCTRRWRCDGRVFWPRISLKDIAPWAQYSRNRTIVHVFSSGTRIAGAVMVQPRAPCAHRRLLLDETTNVCAYYGLAGIDPTKCWADAITPGIFWRLCWISQLSLDTHDPVPLTVRFATRKRILVSTPH